MKAIPEESLRYVLKMHFGSDDVNQSICSHLINELQEIDTLTVSKLRPMCDAKIGNQILLCVDDYGIVSGYKSSNEGDAFGNGCYFRPDELIGWLPLPIYKPEQE